MNLATKRLDKLFENPDEILYSKVGEVLTRPPRVPGDFPFRDCFLLQAADKGYVRTTAALLLAGADTRIDPQEDDGVPFMRAILKGHYRTADVIFPFWAETHRDNPAALSSWLMNYAYLLGEERRSARIEEYLYRIEEHAFDRATGAFNEDYLQELRARVEALAAPPPSAPPSLVP